MNVISNRISGRRVLSAITYILVAVCCYPDGASAESESLTGRMAIFSPVIGGTWHCTVRPSSTASDQKPSESTATYNAVRNNTVHEHTVGTDNEGDDYYGYSDASHGYWHLSINSRGAYAFSVSPDAKEYLGYYWSAITGKRDRTHTSYDRLDHDEILGTLKIGGPPHEAVIKAQCTRTP